MTANAPSPTVWHVGGDDVHKRIPLLHALKERGFRVGAVGSEDGSDFRVHDIPYYRYRLERKLTPLSDLRSCSEFSALLKRHPPDIVHGFDPKPAIAVPIIARQAGIPARVRTITGLGFVFASDSTVARTLRPVYRNLQKWASAASYTIFQNRDDRDYFVENGMVERGREEIVLSSGVDVERIRAEAPGKAVRTELENRLEINRKSVVTMISRIDENKGIREFAEAAEIVNRQRENTAFLLIGPYASEGKDAARFVDSLRERFPSVRYLGPRRDVPALLSLSDLCVLPSYREGLPRILVEAGAMQVPCVTTDVPGCRDVIRDHWNGRLVPPRNARALAATIADLLDDEEGRRRMGERGYRHVREQFDLSYVADAYADIYERALAGQA